MTLRGGRRLVVVAALAVLGNSAARADAFAPSLRAVFDAHVCDVVERLQRIHRSNDPDPSSRHLIIEPTDHPGAYVQCRFDAGDTRMQCEAASGYYPVQDGPRRPHPGDPAALAALGFKADPQGNDAQDFDLAQPPDLGRVARLMLRALHDGYGFRKPTALFIEAPLAKDAGRPLPGCTPVS